jgi:hypothetical protein
METRDQEVLNVIKFLEAQIVRAKENRKYFFGLHEESVWSGHGSGRYLATAMEWANTTAELEKRLARMMEMKPASGAAPAYGSLKSLKTT